MQNDRKGEKAATAGGGDARSIRRLPPDLSAWFKDATWVIGSDPPSLKASRIRYCDPRDPQMFPLRNPSVHSEINRAKRANSEGSWRRARLVWRTQAWLKKLLKG